MKHEMFKSLQRSITANFEGGLRTQNIIKKTIEKLCFNGSKKENLIVALGPAISRKRYVVGKEVVSSIYRTLEKKKYLNNEIKYIPIRFRINYIKCDIIEIVIN